MSNKFQRLLRWFAIVCIVVLIFLSLPTFVRSHRAESCDSHACPTSHTSDGQSTSDRTWLFALASTCVISLVPFLLLWLIPARLVYSDSASLLRCLLGFASGGLLGDALLHLIPHAISAAESHHRPHGTSELGRHDNHQHHHGHEHSHVGDVSASVTYWVLCGFIAFLLIEKFVTALNVTCRHDHGLQNSVANKSPSKKKNSQSSIKASKGKSNIQVSAFLNLTADFVHNFTDGMAIGASYLAGTSIGAMTTFTILLHEVPHEIGDFAILIKSGVSKRSAIMCQLLTAVGALVGTCSVLLANDVGSHISSRIMAFTAGGFLYIASVSVLPELLQHRSFKQALLETLSILVGVYFMCIVDHS